MIKCLENDIIPHVVTNDGKDGYEIEIPYGEAAATDAGSTKPEELSRLFHAGIIPEAYKDVISDIEITETRRKVSDETEADEPERSVYGTPEEMLARAKEGYFVRDPERNLVYCPGGKILRQKCIKKTEIFGMQIKTHAVIAQIEINVTKAGMSGKKQTLRRTVLKNPAGTG